MKTAEQINEARRIIRARFAEESANYSSEQLALVAGMMDAICWVADSPDATTFERFLSGEPFRRPPSSPTVKKGTPGDN